MKHSFALFSLFFTADNGTSDLLVSTHSVYAPLAAATVLLSREHQKGYLWNHRSSDVAGVFLQERRHQTMGSLCIQLSWDNSACLHAHRHTCARRKSEYVLPVACASFWTLVIYSHDRFIHVFIFTFQGHICVVFIFLKTDLYLRLGFYWVILSNPNPLEIFIESLQVQKSVSWK